MNASPALSVPEEISEHLADGDFTPVRLLEIELSQPIADLAEAVDQAGLAYRKVQYLVRLHSRPLGLVAVELEQGKFSASALAAAIWQSLGSQINAHLLEDGLEQVSTLSEQGLPIATTTPRCLAEQASFLDDAPFVSVVIATRERPQLLRRTLAGLLAQRYLNFEILVVDNAPVTSATADLVAQNYQNQSVAVRYLREDRPGASRARNRGIREAHGAFVALTDDDVVIDSHWLLALMSNFQLSERIACVTGMVLPLEIETRAQYWFEQYGGYNKGFARRFFNTKEHHPGAPLFPYTAGQMGTGANSAFRASVLRETGAFDEALGPGTPAPAGEDLALLFQVVERGYTLVYEPAAVLYHPNQRDYEGLRKLMYNYGAGLSAYLTKIVFDRPLLLFDILRRLPYGLYFTLNSRSPKNQRKSSHYPEELSKLELQGMCYGPLLYIRSLLAQRCAHHSL
jgi:glycosyltransferase involved in cell wall biosynthesis